MFCLRQKVRRDDLRVVLGVGDDQNLARAGDHVDGDLPEDLPLCLGDVDVPGADDLVHAGDAFGPVGKRGDGLRAADLENAVDARDVRRGQNGGRDPAARGGRGDHDDVFAARELRGDGVHQNGGRVGRRAAGDVDADVFDRHDLLPEDNAADLLHFIARADLALVIGADVFGGVLQKLHEILADFLARRVDHVGGDLQRARRGAVEFLAVFNERGVVAGDDVADDLAHGRGHVGRVLRAGKDLVFLDFSHLENADHNVLLLIRPRRRPRPRRAASR